MSKYRSPKFIATLDDGTEHEVQTNNQDRVRFDMLRAHNGWPGVTEAPMLWSTVLAWSALSRAGILTGQNAAEELGRIVELVPVEDEAEPADPTQPTA